MENDPIFSIVGRMKKEEEDTGSAYVNGTRILGKVKEYKGEKKFIDYHGNIYSEWACYATHKYDSPKNMSVM